MSIRVTVCALVVLWLCIQAWRGKWLMAACGAILMMAFLERKDMPRSILGIPGLNLWNILIINTTWAWLVWRKRLGLVWDLPWNIRKAFLFYVAVIIWSFSRLLIDPTEYYGEGRFTIVVGYFVNPLKFLIPGIILFDGCRSRQDVSMALGSIVVTYFILAVFVIRYMGLSNFSGDELSRRAARVIQRDVGYHRVDMSMMLAGASWAVIAFSSLVTARWARLSLWAGAGIILVGQALTGGRAGYVTWGVVGLTMCLLRWRKLLPLIPLAVALVVAFAPGVRERMFEGFADSTGAVQAEADSGEITSGRTNAWPLVIDKIQEAPIIGYGRLGMNRTGLSDRMLNEMGEVFGHPHNAYLEMLLDNGIIGFICAMPVFFIILRRTFILFRDNEDVLLQAAGGAALALILALMIAAFGAQTFYPREGVVGMWAAVGVALRAFVARESQGAEGHILEENGSSLRPKEHSNFDPATAGV